MKQVFVYHKKKDITDYIMPASFKVATASSTKAFMFQLPVEVQTLKLYDLCELRDSAKNVVITGEICALKIASIFITYGQLRELTGQVDDDSDEEDINDPTKELFFVYEATVRQTIK